ncbi:class I SAM-dependent methyltransferase [Kineococcus xinjiangensis]|nr:class I SAM-dependent methyltransferase [Kineococcus xinjiangensis]
MSETAAVAANRANWDERVASHLIAYGVEDFIADPTRTTSIVRDDLALMAPHLPGGSPAGLDLVHLQCHIGLDTLSWARLGARVTGIDFSSASTAAARDVAARAGLAATFLDSDVDSALDACGDRFDVVYTGVGALCWLPDLTRWARVVAGLLRPGGLFAVRDAHPVLSAVDDDRSDGALVLTHPYFPTGGPQHYDDGTTYADADVRLQHADTYEWQHSLAEIVQALLDAGLTLTSLAEHRTIPWRALPQMVETAGGYVLPVGGDRLPLTFSLTATKPLGRGADRLRDTRP